MIADVDHLLHLAGPFGAAFAGFDGDEQAEVGLGSAQLLTEQADQFTAPWRRYQAPGEKRLLCRLDGRSGAFSGVAADAGDLLAGERAEARPIAAAPERGIDAEAGENAAGLGGKVDGHAQGPRRFSWRVRRAER